MRLILGKNLECFQGVRARESQGRPVKSANCSFFDQLKPYLLEKCFSAFPRAHTFVQFARGVLHSGRAFFTLPHNKRIGHRIYGRIILFPSLYRFMPEEEKKGAKQFI